MMKYTVDEICEIFFKGKTKAKHIRKFNETTPNGHVITGYINHKPNKYLGSMLIVSVDNEETYQFVQSMPKIHYFTDARDVLDELNYVDKCYEKLDGSCLILYPLKNEKNEIIEIIPKTRGRPIADSYFIELFKKIDQKPFLDFYKKHDNILLFEMYGILNQHEIIHYETGIDLRLIGIVDNNGDFVNDEIIAEKYNFKLMDCLFKFSRVNDGWLVEATSQKYKSYLGNKTWTYPTINETITGIQNIIEELNKEFNNINGRSAVEGVVVNTLKNNQKKWLKIKPHDIELKHRSQNGIPRSSIVKEVLKYFDEYGSSVQEIYLSDKNHHTEYINRMLSEEYDELYILKSKKKIEKIFMQIWENKQVPTSIHNICDELILNNPDKSVTDLMRIFANEYPMKKKYSKMVYNTLSRKIK